LENFTPLPALGGGVLIGLSATLLWAFHGRIAGISGILGSLVAVDSGERLWRLAFLAGLLLGGLQLLVWNPHHFGPSPIGNNGFLLLAAGVLVGFGTQLGNGCTSGHGVCGISRFSLRSIVATCTFIGTGMATVAALQWLL